MLEGVGDSSNLGVDNVADTPPLIPRFCMLGFLVYNTMRIGSGPWTVPGTTHLPLLLPTILECHNPHILLLYIPVAPVDNGSNRMVRSIVRTQKLWDLFGMLA
jgi:hypothetical protein